MTLVDFLLVVLTGVAVIKIWLGGSIFSDARAYLEAASEIDRPGVAGWWKTKLLELPQCGLCLSVHVYGALTAVMLLLEDADLAQWMRYPFYWGTAISGYLWLSTFLELAQHDSK